MTMAWRDLRTHQPGAKWIALVHGFLTFAALPALYLFQARAASDADTGKLCVAFTLGAAWLLFSAYRLCGDVYHPYFLFLVSAILFNGGQFLLGGLGLLNSALLIYGRFSIATTSLTIYLIFASLFMLHLGGLVRAVFPRGASPDGGETGAAVVAVRSVGYSLMWVGALPFLLVAMHEVRASAQGYEGLYAANSSLLFNIEAVLAQLFLPGLIFALAGSAGNRKAFRLLMAVAVLDIGISLLVGTRSRALPLACALLFVWTRCRGRIPRMATAAFLGCLVVILPTVAVLRNLPLAERLTGSGLLSSVTDESTAGLAILSETGMTIATTALAIEFVPQSRPFGHGVSYLQALLLAVPGSGYVLNPSRNPVTLSEWLIGEADPAAAERNGGLGFSFIAEAYLNFGAVWGPLLCALIGFFIACLLFGRNGPVSVAFIGCLLLTLPLLSRSESIVFCRSLLWQCALPALAAHYLIYRKRFLAAPKPLPVPAPQ